MLFQSKRIKDNIILLPYYIISAHTYLLILQTFVAYAKPSLEIRVAKRRMYVNIGTAIVKKHIFF